MHDLLGKLNVCVSLGRSRGGRSHLMQTPRGSHKSSGDVHMVGAVRRVCIREVVTCSLV